MKIQKTEFKGLYVLEPKVYSDERGYFFESFNQQLFNDLIRPVTFVQDNESKSTFGVLRGFHFQVPPMEQIKLVRVVFGEVLDVAVDLRPGSTTQGAHFSIKLSGENKKQLLIPRGFAHGFITLSPYAVFHYKCDNYYSREHESGIRYNDPQLGINWQIPDEDISVSSKDAQLPFYKTIMTGE